VVNDAKALGEALKAIEIKITAKAGGEKLFGSISNIDIAAALEKAGQYIINEAGQVSILGGAYRNLSDVELQSIATGKALTIVNGEIAVSSTAAAAGTNAFTAAMTRLIAILTSAQAALLGIATLIGIAGYKFYQYVTSTTAAEEATKTFKETLLKGATAAEEAKNKILEVGVAFEQAKTGAISKKKALETYNEILGGTIGKADTLAEAEKLYKNNTENYIKATGLRAQAQELFRIAAQKSAEAVTAEQVGFFSFDRKLGESYDDELKRRRQKLTDTSEEIRKKASDLLKEAGSLETGYKPTETKTPDIKKIENDNKAANALLLKLKQENSVNILNEERKKQDLQLKIDKENEEREVNNLKLSKDKEFLRAQLLEQIRIKYGVKVIELNKKRQEEDSKTFDEDQKKIKEYKLYR
jgi:hypothetical protein